MSSALRSTFTVAMTLASCAFGQVVLPVQVNTDEFTGQATCFQMGVVARGISTGLALQTSDDGTLLLMVMHSTGEWGEDRTLSVLGLTADTEIFFRFPDGEVISMAPDAVQSELVQKYEFVALADRWELVYRILASPDDLRIRFNGPTGRADFTIPHAIITGLAEGFGRECIE